MTLRKTVHSNSQSCTGEKDSGVQKDGTSVCVVVVALMNEVVQGCWYTASLLRGSRTPELLDLAWGCFVCLAVCICRV